MIGFCKYFFFLRFPFFFSFASSPCVALFLRGLKGITDGENDHSRAAAFCKTLMGPTHCAEVALIFWLPQPLSPSPTALSPLIFALHPLRSPLQPPSPVPPLARLSSPPPPPLRPILSSLTLLLLVRPPPPPPPSSIDGLGYHLSMFCSTSSQIWVIQIRFKSLSPPSSPLASHFTFICHPTPTPQPAPPRLPPPSHQTTSTSLRPRGQSHKNVEVSNEAALSI